MFLVNVYVKIILWGNAVKYQYYQYACCCIINIFQELFKCSICIKNFYCVALRAIACLLSTFQTKVHTFHSQDDSTHLFEEELLLALSRREHNFRRSLRRNSGTVKVKHETPTDFKEDRTLCVYFIVLEEKIGESMKKS